MTTIFILVKDHLRRNWKSLTLMSLGFAFVASFIMLEASDASFLTKYYSSLLYVYYAIFAWLIGMNNDLDFVRFSRALPFRESALANLVWSMAVVAPAVFSFVVVLLVVCLAFCFGKGHSLPIAWPLLFLLLATLCSGVLTFVRTLIPRLSDPILARHHLQEGAASFASYIAGLLFAGPCAVAAGVLLFFPTPTRWSDLTPLHLAGMGLAAFLTWRSYRLRDWLLHFDFRRNAIAQRSAKLEDLLKSKGMNRPPTLEDVLKSKGIDPHPYGPVMAALVNLSKFRQSAPRHYGSVLAAVAQDLKTIVRSSLITALLGVGLISLMQFCLAWSGLAPRGSTIYESIASAITLVAVYYAAAVVYTQFGRLSAFGAVRALPLTGNQCVWLFLSYPYAVTLAVVPCLTAYAWLTGYGHPFILLLDGILLSAALCPFAMFLVARFGRRSLFIMIGLFIVGQLVFLFSILIFGVYSAPLSPPILYAGGVVLLAVLGSGGFYGLRHIIENNNAVYKRKPSPQLFGQRFER